MPKNSAKHLTVLYLIESAGRGGAETVVVALATARDGRARVASLRSGWMWERLAEGEVPVQSVSYSPRSDLLLAYRIAKVIDATRPDVVHCNCFTMNIAGALGAALAGVPSICTVHGAIYDLDTRARRVAYRLAGMLHKRLVTVSQYLRGEMHLRTGIPSSKIDVIYNGVPAPHVGPDGPASVRRDYGLDGSAFVVGSVGMFRPEKGHADLIDAVALARKRVPGMRLLLVGDGKCKSDLSSRAKDLELNGTVKFIPPACSVPLILSAVNVFALPSHTEGLSIATIEAMSCGTPVVVTDCGGPTEIVKDGVTGLVVPPCEPEAMAEALVRVAKDAELRACLAANGKARAADVFSLDQMLRSYEQLYQEIRR